MAKTSSEVRLIARTHTRTAIAVLVGIMRSEKAQQMARVAAANSLLDRGWGKAVQPIANDDDKPFEITQIICKIVDPKHPKRDRLDK